MRRPQEKTKGMGLVMTFSLPAEMSWHNDGHAFSLEIQRETIRITEIRCPNEDDANAACAHRTVGCLVRWFLSNYGLDCNVGVSPAAPEIPIAWSLQGDGHELDLTQIWIIPTTDALFASWLNLQETEE